MLHDWLILAGGLALLIVGGELLVRGAVAVAEKLGMSPLLIGLTLVGFGTATPELVTSVKAAMVNAPGIAIGNIVGSNTANILLILGISALFAPIAVSSIALKRDGTIMLGATILFTLVSYFYTLDRIVGVAFIAILIGYILFAYFQERRAVAAGHALASAAGARTEAIDELHKKAGAPSDPEAAMGHMGLNTWVAVLMAIAGLVLVIFGAELLVDGATAIARVAGMSETVIGLTVVAIGTSMPEFVASLVAALRGHNDVALGNVIGSNIYSLLGIGGGTALINPTNVPPEIIAFDNPVMIGASVILLIFAATGLRLGRIEGLVMLIGYAAYIYLLIPK